MNSFPCEGHCEIASAHSGKTVSVALLCVLMVPSLNLSLSIVTGAFRRLSHCYYYYYYYYQKVKFSCYRPEQALGDPVG
jgi:hypothetical protein